MGHEDKDQPMATRKVRFRNVDPAVDAYIEAAPDFAKPILWKIREAFHKACPEVQEKMRWSSPSFDYKGLLGGMAAFKRHVSLGFWKSKLMDDPHGLIAGGAKQSHHHIKFTSVDDMPPDHVLEDYIRQAVALNEAGAKPDKAKKASDQRRLDIPEDLAAALAANPAAKATFDAFSYSHKKEYVEWIAGAKRESTRQKRLATTIEWLSEGKPRNWKYVNRC